ncbi:CLUMA_CG003527, isoform A [Clunio marinus]|uniref:CLUMA_CG003527, isoform A n=1 Tax=Clunio marinus TaxID=568069 RepID=A0A1J1HP30_9DIPT|nr:CLUMA_CG003527, isoform A [Clunio marinus]
MLSLPIMGSSLAKSLLKISQKFLSYDFKTKRMSSAKEKCKDCKRECGKWKTSRCRIWKLC